MFKILVMILSAISVTLGKNKLVITQFENDKEIRVVSLLVVASTGDNVTFHCKIDGKNVKQDAKWITPSDNFKLLNNDPSKLNLPSVQSHHAGMYSCVSKSQRLHRKFDLYIKSGNVWDQKNNILSKISEVKSDFLKHAFEHPDLPTQLSNNRNYKIPDYWKNPPEYKHFEIPEFKHFEIPEFKPIEIPKINTLPPYIEFANVDIDTSKEVEFLKQTTRNSTYTHFKQSIYIVPVTILIVLGFVRLCYYLRNQSSVPWQQLSSPDCTHEICTHRRRTNPSASCIIQSRLSVLVIQRFTGTREENTNNNNNPLVEGDAPPDYNDVNSSDLPPSYNEAVENMNSDSSNVTNNSNLPV